MVSDRRGGRSYGKCWISCINDAMLQSHPTIALTVDVEGTLSGVEAETMSLLELFSQFRVRATFFILGEVAEAHPHLVRTIASASHEVGFHGFHHVFLSELGPSRFAAELSEWLPRLEDLAQCRIKGFRAPYFSVGSKTAWALPILAGTSLRYDASIYPGLHDRYGWLGAPKQPVRLAGTSLVLYPVPLLHAAIPIAFSGGSYLRILPWRLVLWGLHRNSIRNRPGMIYVHPWEFSSSDEVRCPTIVQEVLLRRGSSESQLRSRMGRRGLRSRLEQIFRLYGTRLRPLAEVVSALPDLPEWQPKPRRRS